MRTKDELFREAQRRVAARRQQAVTLAEDTHRSALALHKELAEAEDARTQAGLALTMAAALGKDLEAAKAALEQAEATLEQERQKCGYTAADFAPAFSCPICRDTGVTQGVACTCVNVLVRRLRREEINQASPLALCGFDSFDLLRYSDVYDPERDADTGVPLRQHMSDIFHACRMYANKFGPHSTNLMFTGSAGLGKTHLALAIADTVLERGFDVLYTSAAALVAQLGREHFDRESNEEWLSACKEADLLILDDLGTEYVNALSISVLYELVNTRMLCRRPTIYTTNLTDANEFEARYTEKVASRIFGNCLKFVFKGEDQRLARYGAQ